MRLAVIASMKSGLEQFIYREIHELANRGIAIRLFPTKHRPGLYNPRPEWDCQRWTWWKVLGSQPLRLLSMPIRYISVLIHAIRYRAVGDFLLAAYFAPAISETDGIYATFGDRKLFVGYFCKQLLNIPLAVEIHAYELYQNPNPALFPVALHACDRIIAATQHNRSVLHNWYGVSERSIDVVRYSIDLRDYQPATKFVVLIVAFFVEKKGHEVLLEAVKEMGRQDIEVWVVGGTGGSSSVVDVEAIVEKLGMKSQVAFFGKLSGTALKAVYHACDVFCLPSRVDRHGDSEGFPNVIIEAMACGKPVVTTRHVEIPRIVEQILVEENDVHGLAEALERVYQSPSLRAELGQRNRELAEEYFSLRNVGQTVELLISMSDANLDVPPRPVEANEVGASPSRLPALSQLEQVV